MKPNTEREERYFQGTYTEAWVHEMVERGLICHTEAWLLQTIQSFQRNGTECWLSNEALGERSNIKVRQTQIYISKLINLGLLVRTEGEINGRLKRILTCVTPSKEGGVIHAQYNARVIHPRGAVDCACYTPIHIVRNNNNTMSEVEYTPPTASEILPKKQKKEINPVFRRMAKQLASAISAIQRAEIRKPKYMKWINHFSLLHDEDGFDIPRIKVALDFYCDKVGLKLRYFPVVRCGASFREKFSKIEWAMEKKNMKDDSEDDPPQGPAIHVHRTGRIVPQDPFDGD